MPRRIDEIYPERGFITAHVEVDADDGGIDGDATILLLLVCVHLAPAIAMPSTNLLLVQQPSSLEQSVRQRRLTMVNMRDDTDIADVGNNILFVSRRDGWDGVNLRNCINQIWRFRFGD